MRDLTPKSLHPPFAKYSHAVAVPQAHRWLFSSGQLAVDADGTTPTTVQAQADLIFANLDKILEDDGMTRDDIVRLNAFVTDRAHMAGYMAARDVWMGPSERRYASTLVIVSGFTRPEFLVEIEMTAARAIDP